MNKPTFRIALIAGLLTLAPLSAPAADQDQDRTEDMEQARDQERVRDAIYGSQLMSEQERNEYRARMRAAKTAEEREQIRNEHHERMQKRAEEQGLSLPDTPPKRGYGMDGEDMPRGGGMGNGMGSGGGMMRGR